MTLNDIPKVLLFLSFSDSLFLINLFHDIYLKYELQFNLSRYVEKTMNVVLLIVKYNYAQLLNTKDSEFQAKLMKLVSRLRDILQQNKNRIGKNIAAQIILTRQRNQESVDF